METELETTTTEGEQKHTRAKVLKRAGVGAAALWTVPLFVTTGAASAANVKGTACITRSEANGEPAGAYGYAPCRVCPCDDPNGGFVGPICDPQGNGRCFCFVDVKGCCQCRDVTQVGCDQPRCTSSKQCPRGWKCVYTCCDGCADPPEPGPGDPPGRICLPPCSSTAEGPSVEAVDLALVRAG